MREKDQQGNLTLSFHEYKALWELAQRLNEVGSNMSLPALQAVFNVAWLDCDSVAEMMTALTKRIG